jgi:hypothetical protein
MSDYYRLQALTKELIFIKWYRLPSQATKSKTQFIAEMTQILNETDAPVYFLSDLRQGRIVDVNILQKLGGLTQHENYGGGSAFSQDVLSEIFVGLFSRFAAPKQGDSVFYDKLEDALAFLESTKPGLAQNIDWNAVLAEFG